MTNFPDYHPETDIPAILEGCYGIMRECAKIMRECVKNETQMSSRRNSAAARRSYDRTQAQAIGWASRDGREG